MTAVSPARTVRLGRISFRLNRGTIIACAVLIALTVSFSLLALSLGAYTVSLPDIVRAIAGGGSEEVRRVVVEWRLPRVLAAAVFGAALGMSGSLFQSLTRNPLGSPDVIGFTTGSLSGVLIAMLLGGTGYLATASGALIGGLLTALGVYALAWKRGVQGFRLIVVGIALGAMLTSLNTWIMVKVDVEFAMRASVWGAGTLNGTRWEQLTPALIAAAGFALAAAWLGPRVQQLALGDDAAAALGLRVERTKLAMIVVGIGLTALVTAAAGPIAFVALAAPQVARRLRPGGAPLDLVTSACVGAALLSGADLIAQHAFPGLTVPVGAVTVCLGGGYLIWLLARETKRG